jgi:tetratricopeptide (TPR) repeat protein
VHAHLAFLHVRNGLCDGWWLGGGGAFFWQLRGIDYLCLLCRLDEAIADFSLVLQQDPNHIKASYARGACQNLKGDFAEAIRALLYM